MPLGEEGGPQGCHKVVQEKIRGAKAQLELNLATFTRQ